MKENKITVSQEIKKHLLTGISWMIPLIVAAGICIALGQVLGGTDVGEKTGTIPWMLNQIGGWGMGLIVPLISAAIAYSIADRPGFAPGLIVGFLCGQIHTGFIGGMLGGFLVGYTILLLKRYIRLPQSMQGLMPIMVLPVLSTIIGGLLMMTLIGKPIAWLQEALIHLLESMQGGSRFLMGAILGAMATFDFGGPVNKTMSLFSDGLLVSGVYGPEAVKFVGSIIPPFGITLSFLLTRHKYTRAEREALKAAFPMGICMITEGVIPIAARDPTASSGILCGGIGGRGRLNHGVGRGESGSAWRHVCCASVHPSSAVLPGAGYRHGDLWRDAFTLEETGNGTRRRV